MPEVQYTTEVAAPIEAVWRYVEELENWAPFVIGFQGLDIVDDRRSLWRLRGDVGVMAREVELQADITVWEPCRRVDFTVIGINEQVEGDGHFLLEDAAVGDAAAAVVPPPRRGWWHRLRMRFARLLLRWLTRRQRRERSAPPTGRAPRGSAGAGADEPKAAAHGSTGDGHSRLTFRLRVTPGGPMAPMVEVLMAPMLEPAASDLADRIRDALESDGAVKA